jgi:hypothetical protein
MFYGLKSGLNEAFEIDAADLRSFEKSDLSLIHPLVGGQEIGRYEIKGDIRYFIVLQAGWTKAQMSAEGAKEFSERTAAQWLNTRHPSIHRHLARFETGLRKRDDQGDYWWEFRPCDYYEVFSRPKIIFPDICKGPRFHLDATGLYLTNTAYCLDTADRYLLGVLNSKVFWFSIANISIPFGVRAGKFRYRLIYQYMEKVPIREIHSKEDKSRSERIGTLVTESLDLHKKIASLRTPQERTSLERQIAATDAQIDRLVYELYGLTEDEIKIIEQATA